MKPSASSSTVSAPLTLSRRIALMEQVCVGLAYAHRHGIVHRDVKPANLMISRDSGVLKVLDFGVAGRVDADPGLQGQMLMGTPNYMSPEQVVGQASDHRSDIFSVGLVLYELLTYRQAFSGESQQSILLKVLNESPQPLAALVPGIDPALPAIVDRALEKSVDRRYPDLEAMRSDLSRVGQRVHAAETSHDLVGRGTVAARGRGRAGRAPAPPPDGGAARQSGAEPVSGPGSEPRHEPTSELSPGLSLEPSPGPRTRAGHRGSAGGGRARRLRGTLRRRDPPARGARTAPRRRRRAAPLPPDRRRPRRGPRPGRVAADHGRHPRPRRRRARRHLRRPLARGAGAAADARTRRARARRRGSARRTGTNARGRRPPAEGFGEPEPRPMRRDDEVAHYLSRARRRLEAGDVTAAQSLLDAALDMTRTP